MIVSLLCKVTSKLLSLPSALLRGDTAKTGQLDPAFSSGAGSRLSAQLRAVSVLAFGGLFGIDVRVVGGPAGEHAQGVFGR